MKWPLVGRSEDLDTALESARAGTGVAVLGSAGVGKSRLLHELVDRMTPDEADVVQVRASEATRSIPLAPFVDLLPVGPTPDPLAMLGMALEELNDRGKQSSLLLTVDDAHHLDDLSISLLLGIVAAEAATVCLTARTGEPMRADLVDLWTNGVIERIDLSALERYESRALSENVLGRVGPGLEEELWRLAQGNPLVLHELIKGAVDISVAQDTYGTWIQTGPLAESPRVADLVTSRLGSLPEHLRSAVELVALGAPVPMVVYREGVGPDPSPLEEAGLVAVLNVANQQVVVPAHPLFGELLKVNVKGTRRRKAYRTLAEGAIANPHSVDIRTAAMWQSEAAVMLSIDLAVAGATEALARHDPALAERLIRPTGLEDDRAVLILGRALRFQHRFDEAEEVLGGRTLADPGLHGELASVRGRNLAFGLGRFEEGKEVLRAAVAIVDDAEMRARLLNELGMISSVNGNFIDARSASERVLSDRGSSDVTRVAAYVTLAIAQSMTGNCAGLDEVIADAVQLAGSVRDELPLAQEQILIMHVVSMANAGRIGEAIALARNGRLRSGSGSVMQALWLNAVCSPLDVSGQLAQVTDTANRAIELFADADTFGLEPQARGLVALACGQQGDQEGGGALESVTQPTPAPRLSVWVDRGRAWMLVASGKSDDAVTLLIAGGSNAAAGEHFPWAALCFHDVVRLGRPELVLDRLNALPSMHGAHLIHAMIAHASALSEGDSEAMSEVAGLFAKMGAALLAAEVWAQAASLHAETDPMAARHVLLSMASQSHCENPQTPALNHRPALISPRESQIALAAGSGLTGPQIAQSLYLSVRTVNNHLQSVYRKLGINSRDELRHVLAPVLLDE